MFPLIMKMNEPAKMLPITDDGIGEAARHLESGEIVCIPTETVYGLAANALDENACRRVFEIKGRPLIDPLIVHVRGFDSLEPLARCTPHAEILAEHFWPGPLTIVLRKTNRIPDLITAGLPSVAVRAPAHPVTQKLLQRTGLPLAAPSANPFGYLSPTLPKHVMSTLGTRIPAILDGGPCTLGIESTIVDARENDQITVLRQGPISIDELEKVLPCQLHQPRSGTHCQQSPQEAPGMLTKHYSPRAAIKLVQYGSVNDEYLESAKASEPLILNTRPTREKQTDHVYWLSEKGNPAECAKNLFALLHALDGRDVNVITVELAPSSGIGSAVNDRLYRAAAPR